MNDKNKMQILSEEIINDYEKRKRKRKKLIWLIINKDLEKVTKVIISILIMKKKMKIYRN